MRISHSNGSYEIVSEPLESALGKLPADARILTDERVLEIVGHLLPRGVLTFAVPAGEESKSLATFGECVRWLADTGASRKTTVVALGGGVVGDLAGFAAASFMRGVPYIQVPTTLLAQVDSSVGGKVGVDLPEGKNLVGAFYPPTVVYICHDALHTLPDRQLRNGLAEVLKYGFIMDPGLFELIDDDGPLTHHTRMEQIVLRCIALKAKVVEQDEQETTGLRAILNFGHTVGHAIEHVTGYGPVLHGEAISIGMTVEAKLGERLGVTPAGVAQKVQTILAAHGLPTTHEALRHQDLLIGAMRRDKKAQSGRMAFSLLTSLGECKLVLDVDEDAIRLTLDDE